MNLFFIYDMPNWQLFLLIEIVFVVFFLSGSFFFSEYLEKKWNILEAHTDTINNFVAINSIFYGITLGLIAVGTFENFEKAEDIVNKEATSIAALYRDVNMLSDEGNSVLRNDLKKYTNCIIENDWPLQKKGEIPVKSTLLIDTFQTHLGKYNIRNERDAIIYEEVLNQFNVLVESRRVRLITINSGLPSSIWVVLILGAVVNIATIWLLKIRNRKLEILLNTMAAILLGSVIYLIASMDYPLRGEFGITSDAFELILTNLINR